MSEQEITKELTFITSTFLAGADQNKPEIRAPSIRGALRWWFRVLSTEDPKRVWKQEAELFGSVHTKPHPIASPIVIHAESLSPQIKTISTKLGMAIQQGVVFELQIVARHPVDEVLWDRLKEAVTAFSRLGALGRKATRGYGLIALSKKKDLPTESEFREWAHTLRNCGISIFLGKPQVDARLVLKGLRKSALRENHTEAWKIFGRIPLPGGRGQTRQTSPLRIGIARFSDKEPDFPILFYTAKTSQPIYTAKTSQPTSLWDSVRRNLMSEGFEEL